MIEAPQTSNGSNERSAEAVEEPAKAVLRARLARNVMANWLGYLVFAASGFVLPRLISDNLGRDLLGIWDFAWLIVSYAGLLTLGVGGAASRYIARHRAREDWLALSAMASSCLAVLVVASVLAVGLALMMVWVTPRLIPSVSPDLTRQAQLLTAIFSFNVVILLPIALFDGVLSGYERFDLKNTARCACHLAGLGVMVSFVLSGYGLVALACTSVAAELATGLIYVAVACRLCPQMRLSASLVTWNDMKEAIAFGAKTVLQTANHSILYMGNGLIVAYFLGPSTLAVYARQRALVMCADRFLRQYGNVFAPRSSSLQARDAVEELRLLLIQSTKYALCVALPLTAILVVSGGPLVSIWMGPEYVSQVVLVVLAIGHVAAMAHRGPYQILVGLNRHGRVALANLATSLCSIALALFLVGVLSWGMVGAAVAVAVAATLGGGVLPGLYACRAVGLPVRSYLAKVIPAPILMVIPFALCLVVSKLLVGGRDFLELALGVGTGVVVLSALYWRYLVPAEFRTRLAGRFGFGPKRAIHEEPVFSIAQAQQISETESIELRGVSRIQNHE